MSDYICPECGHDVEKHEGCFKRKHLDYFKVFVVGLEL